MPGRYSFVHWLILRADEPHRPSTAAAFTTVPNAIRCCHLLDIPERGTRVMPNKPLAAAWQVRRRVSEGMAPLDATFLVRSTRGRFEHDRTHAGFGESRPAAQAADRKEAMAQRQVFRLGEAVLLFLFLLLPMMLLLGAAEGTAGPPDAALGYLGCCHSWCCRGFGSVGILKRVSSRRLS